MSIVNSLHLTLNFPVCRNGDFGGTSRQYQVITPSSFLHFLCEFLSSHFLPSHNPSTQCYLTLLALLQFSYLDLFLVQVKLVLTDSHRPHCFGQGSCAGKPGMNHHASCTWLAAYCPTQTFQNNKYTFNTTCVHANERYVQLHKTIIIYNNFVL